MAYIFDSHKAGTVDGFEIVLNVYSDDYATPDDYDGYTPKQVEAWKNQEWQFVGVEVTASRAGIELGRACLLGIEFGSYLTTTEDDKETGRLQITAETLWNNDGDYLAGEAIDNAKEKLKELVSA